MTLQSYLRILAERWRLIVLFVLVGTGIAVLLTATTPKTYQASVIVQPDPTTTTIAGSDQRTQDLAATLQGYAGLGQVAVATARLLHRPFTTVGDLGASEASAGQT